MIAEVSPCNYAGLRLREAYYASSYKPTMEKQTNNRAPKKVHDWASSVTRNVEKLRVADIALPYAWPIFDYCQRPRLFSGRVVQSSF